MARRDSLHRRRPTRGPLPRFLIVCEDKLAAPQYFKGMRHIERIPIELVVEPAAGVPRTLVQRAKQLKQEAERQAKAQRDDNLLFDQVWCVFDRDEHPMFAEACQQARDNGLETAISNPCFELWLLLHFQEQTAYLNRKKAQSLCRDHMKGYEKSVSYSSLKEQCSAAIERAERLDSVQIERRNPGGNPSTGVYRLAGLIRQQPRPYE